MISWTDFSQELDFFELLRFLKLLVYIIFLLLLLNPLILSLTGRPPRLDDITKDRRHPLIFIENFPSNLNLFTGIFILTTIILFKIINPKFRKFFSITVLIDFAICVWQAWRKKYCFLTLTVITWILYHLRKKYQFMKSHFSYHELTAIEIWQSISAKITSFDRTFNRWISRTVSWLMRTRTGRRHN